jgi:chemotaxis protein MotA
MDMEIETHHHEVEVPGHVMSKTGDATPAFGIVVAVMGVVNVMGSVGEPPPVLGKMIGGALVGTFLGYSAFLWVHLSRSPRCLNKRRMKGRRSIR